MMKTPKIVIADLDGMIALIEHRRHWLDKFKVPFQLLKMRPADDFTPDEKLKRQWIAEYDLANILCVFDDRKKVVDMWRELGLTCFQVAPGDF